MTEDRTSSRMRIVSGKLKGRTFNDATSGSTHPMAEKIRGALFNSLGDIKGLRVLDAFSGTGALAFEAISRGAKHVLAIELDKRAFADIVNSAKALQLDKQVDVVRGNVATKVRSLEGQYDLVFCDPPYSDINRTVLRHVASAAKTDGVIVFSLPDEIDLGLSKTDYTPLATKNYGDATLQLYRRV